MPDNMTRTIEINGVKLDVDLRTATTIETLAVGDRVKILMARYSGGSMEVKAGVIVGFEPFLKLPTILIAYLTTDFTGGEVKILSWNEKSEDIEVVKCQDDVLFDKAEGLRALDKSIMDAELKLAEAQERKAYFLKHFRAYWTNVPMKEESAGG